MLWLSLNSSFRQLQTKELGHEVSSHLPPILNVDNQVIFPFLLEKTWFFPTLIGGMADTLYSSSVPTTFAQDCSYFTDFYF